MKLAAIALTFSSAVAAATAAEVAVADACYDVKSEKKCYATKDASGQGCVWCDCKAVPSICVSPDQAKDLPDGVYDCKSPGVFAFNDYQTHHLKESAAENSDLCDPSSKSISGYMDITGSKYDENGEDKHLFFWMFEKRPSENATSDGEIPFVVW